MHQPEVLPVSICQAFMDGLYSCLLAGFRTHFPNYSKLQVRTATHQPKQEFSTPHSKNYATISKKEQQG
jgi:hypothetical protein